MGDGRAEGPSATWDAVKVSQLCPTLCDPTDYTGHGVLQARTLEWVAFPFSRGSSQPRHRTQVSHIAGWFFTSWATREAQEYWSRLPIPSPGDLPDPGIEPGSPALQAYSLPTELSGKPRRWRASWNFSYTWRWWNAHSLSLEVPNLKVHKEGTYWIQTTNGLEIFPI